MRALTLISLLFFSQLGLSAGSAKVVDRTTVEMVFEIELQVTNKCIYGVDYAAWASCKYSLGGTLPTAGKVFDQEIIGDLYFEGEIYLNKTQVVLEIVDNFSEDPKALQKDMQDYYSKNKIIYRFKYFGPKFDFDPKKVGQPIDFNN